MPGPGLPAASVWALAPQYYCLEIVGEEQLQGAFSYSGGHTAGMQWSSNSWPEIIQQAETSKMALTGILLSGPPSPCSRVTFRGPRGLGFPSSYAFSTTQQALSTPTMPQSYSSRTPICSQPQLGSLGPVLVLLVHPGPSPPYPPKLLTILPGESVKVFQFG